MAISITVVATLMKALRISKITPFSAECILISKNNCILRAVFVTEFEAHLRHEHIAYFWGIKFDSSHTI